MAFITANEVKSIRVALKEKYPNLKFSVQREHNSSVRVSIMKGDLDFTEVLDGLHNTSLNYFYPENYGEHKKLVEDITEVIRTAPAKDGGREWFDDSISYSDYFRIAYYFNINVGKFDKEYEKI